MIRRRSRDVLTRRLNRHARPLADDDLAASTLVLAPHPDDETLGCGGLVAIKRAMGVDVTIVFMTDGAGSHPKITPAELAALRRCEAVDAAGVLGVDEDRLHFLDNPDGELDASSEATIRQLASIVTDAGATQVIAPHPLEPPADHHATFVLADAAVRSLGRTMPTLLYPVWLWDQWPWTNPLIRPRSHGRRQILSLAARDRLGWRLSRYLSHFVDISEVVDQKQAALACHLSQMTRPVNRPDWMTFSDVSGGEWLDRMLQSHEYYATGRIGCSPT